MKTYKEVIESNTIHTGSGGRLMYSAHAVLSKAKEIATKEHGNKPGKPVVTMAHKEAAKKHIYNSFNESEDFSIDGVENDITKEQKAIYDKQTSEFMKDRVELGKDKIKEDTMEKASFKEYITEYKTYEAKHVKWVVNHGEGHTSEFKPHEDDKAKAKFDEVKSNRGAWIAAVDQRGQSIRMNSLKAMRKKAPVVTESDEAVNEDSEINEISTDAKHKYVVAARKSVGELGQAAYVDSANGDKEGMKKKVEKLTKRNDTAIRTMGKAAIETKKAWNKDFGIKESSPFDWKNSKSEIDWHDKAPKTSQSKEGGTVYKARETQRNAETGGKKDKQAVGRPTGEYGSYKIDKAKRDDPNYKSDLSKKVMASKAEGFKDRDEWKKQMHDAIMKRQLEISGLDPKDHQAAIDKKNPIKK